ncbi:MAG: DUF4402 domain-containing protein [Lentimicrobium sp.]|uniref:DUF4402 domain-containing protein n=1 Tax=Lentimicrobium sp. TaxID=2034841 RepID=UPI0025FCFB0E|nr:DUF4402 domain-containing protein [Lentimicrobium sp.]MCO5256874.1 DUF4402 domain-containing protein [Lentimicrobium sp.]MCO5261599.1 DUF4402 domain-containing protein [Lentimicrobium sp.]
MKKVTIILTGVILMAITSMNVFGQGSSATDDATATARIITPISLVNTQGLAFGNIAASSNPGTVTITPEGVRSHTGGVTPSIIGTYNNAIYSATGEPNATYTITLPGSISISDGTNTMSVNNFTSTPAAGTLSAAGSQTINVGATVNVGASQPTGNYTGSYDVTIAYN